MKQNNKEKSNSKHKIPIKKINNNNNKNNNNPFYPIKYFCFNEVKKIVNNKNKKSPISNKNNEKIQSMKKSENNKKEEEDDYCKGIYFKKLTIPHNISSINIRKKKFHLNKIDINTHYLNNSSDERYKTINKFGLYTKKIFCGMNINKDSLFNTGLKKSKFSKKNNKKKKIKNKMKLSNNNNFLDIHDINNININTNTNNLIYKSNNINESNNTITSNTITSKTIINNTMSNYTLSNITPNSNYNKTNNTNNTYSNIVDIFPNNNEFMEVNQGNKSNNIKVIRNNGRNKNINNNIIKEIRNKKQKKKNKEIVFVRRIILEEKFTIDSKGDKKTIYIKKINPIMEVKDTLNSADKRLILNKKKIKNSNNYNTKEINNNYNNKDNTFINHNDINLNFNVCSFQKINVNDNIDEKNEDLLSLCSKLESFDEDNKISNNNNNDKNTNIVSESIIKNYHNFFNIKNGKKIIYQKPNKILYKTENNHKSYQRLFSNPNQNHLIKSSGNDYNKQKSKINQIIINNINNNKKDNDNDKINKISTKDFDYNNTPLKYLFANPRFLKNKMVHRKNQSNYFISKNMEREQQSNYDYYYLQDEESHSLPYKKSLSFVGKTPIYNLIKKLKDNPKKEITNKLKKNNTISGHVSPKIKDYVHLSPININNNSKNITKMNSNNNSKYIKKINAYDKSNNYINDSSENNSRCHSLTKIKGQNNYNSNDIKLFISYLKNNMINNSGRNKSHRNFLIKKYQKYNLNNLINKNKKSNSKKENCTNIIYFKNKAKNKIVKKK